MQQQGRLLPAVCRIADGQQGTLLACRLHDGVKIEIRRSHQHRTADAGRLDRILPAQRQQAAANECQRCQPVISKQLAHRIAEPDPYLSRHGRCLAAAGIRDAALLQQGRHFVKTLRMPGHQYDAGRKSRRQGIQQQGFLAFAGTGQHHHRPVTQPAPELLCQRHAVGRRADVKLGIAQHGDLTGPESSQAPGIVFGLGGYSGKLRQRRCNQGPDPGITTRRTPGQPGIGQKQRYAGLVAGPDQVGPQFGFHQHAKARAQLLDKPAGIAFAVIGQVAHAGIRKQLPGRLAPGRRHLGDHQRQLRKPGPQGGDQRRRSTGFAHRNGMQPDGVRWHGQRRRGKALVPVFQIRRLPPSAPAQVNPCQRQQRTYQPAVGAPRQRHAMHSCKACQTASTSGHWPMPPRLRARGVGITPVSCGSVSV